MITGTRPSAAQPAADLEAVEPGQHQVEDDQVGGGRASAGQRGLAVAASSTSYPAARR